MQLVAYGAQDIYLTGNPQITFFKVVYRRHTNFSMEAIEQTVNGTSQTSDTGRGNGTVTISRNGDLVHKVYVRVISTAGSNTSDGNNVVDEVELEIGGQKIDKHNVQYMKVMNELSTSESKAIGLKALTGGVGNWGNVAGGDSGVSVCMIPLQFWFCRNPGLALPLIALQYHEVKFKFTWGITTVASNCAVFCDYIYLDTDERRRFAQQSHEYLIEQVQIQTQNSTQQSQKLNFNHPVKELVWTTALNAMGTRTLKLSLNGHDRFSGQRAEYFQLRQPLDHHTAVPRQNLPSSAQLTSNFVTVGNNILAAAMTSEEDVATAGADGNVTADGNLQVSLFADRADNVTTAFDATATVANTGYCVTDGVGAANNFIVGRVYQITFGNGNDNALGNGRTLTATLTGRLEGTTGNDAAAIEVEATTTVLFFDKLLVSAAAVVADTAIAAGRVVINGISLLTPDSNVATQARTSTLTSNINVYSFALKPEEHQPSGTCNFSRIDTAKFEFSGGTNLAAAVENIYAVNYNVLRIMSGMGGLAYSN